MPMPTYLVENVKWLHTHAVLTGDDGWICRVSGAEIGGAKVAHPLYDESSVLSGQSRMIAVIHMYCPVCQPNWRAPMVGEPVGLDKLTEEDVPENSS